MAAVLPPFNAAVDLNAKGELRTEPYGPMSKATWTQLPTNIGYSLKGICVGAERLLGVVKDMQRQKGPDGPKVRVLELGPGHGELVPMVLELGAEVTVVGEAHHIEKILESYSHMGTLNGAGGFFPEVTGNHSHYDIIFASRVLHCGLLSNYRRVLEGVHRHLRPGGMAIIETTSPWSYYYQAFWPRFEAEQRNGEAPHCFEVLEEDMVQAGLTKSNVVLFTPRQAQRLHSEIGFAKVEIEPFRIVACGEDFGTSQQLAIYATKALEGKASSDQSSATSASEGSEGGETREDEGSSMSGSPYASSTRFMNKRP